MNLTNEQLKDMLERQIKLNQKFNGENWKDNVSTKNISIAVFTEIAELYESSPKQWKWWKPYLDNDKQNQYIELVDIVHFGLSYMLMHFTVQELIDMNQPVNGYFIEDEQVAFFNFKEAPSVQNFYIMVERLAGFANLDLDSLVEVYYQKLELNHKRVDGGYMKDVYQKVDSNGNEDNRAINIEH